MLPLKSIGSQGATRLGPAHLGHTEHAAGTPAPGMQHCPAQDRLGKHALRFRQPNLGGHAQRFAARHKTDLAAMRQQLNELMEENCELLKKRLGHQDDAGSLHGKDADPVLAARQEALHQTEEVARLNKMLQEARGVAKIKKDTLDWIMQNLL